MLKSMTGYGRAEEPWNGGTITAELRSVNHRFCEVVVRLPKAFIALEDDLKKAVQERCARGRIELSISLSGGKEPGKRLSLDYELARQYHGLLRDLKKRLRLAGSVDLGTMAGFRDIITVGERPADERQLAERLKQVTGQALGALDEMRRREGVSLSKDLTGRLKSVRVDVAAIAERAPVVAQQNFDRMKARVEKLVGSADLDIGRLHQELAVYADRADISEELTRLRSHLDQFEGTLKSREPVGRTMDFLLQEMGREVNTLGAKANDAEIAGSVVKLKAELEKIREQVQNIE